MNEDNSKPLVERYYKWEKSVWTIALLLIVWQVFGLNDATSLPLLDVELRDPGKISTCYQHHSCSWLVVFVD
jgi:hypothetical protein